MLSYQGRAVADFYGDIWQGLVNAWNATAWFLSHLSWQGVGDVFRLVVNFFYGVWTHLTNGQGVALQTAVLAIGGLWALRIYRNRREGQATVRTGMSVAIVKLADDDRTMMVRVHVTNTSAVLVRGVRAELVLFEASGWDRGNAKLNLRGEAVDPLQPVNGELKTPAANGTVGFKDIRYRWYNRAGLRPHLEPGECVESEVAFRLESEDKRWALRLIVTGKQGRIPASGHYDWGIFGIVDPGLLPEKGYASVSVHAIKNE